MHRIKSGFPTMYVCVWQCVQSFFCDCSIQYLVRHQIELRFYLAPYRQFDIYVYIEMFALVWKSSILENLNAVAQLLFIRLRINFVQISVSIYYRSIYSAHFVVVSQYFSRSVFRFCERKSAKKRTNDAARGKMKNVKSERTELSE